MGQQMGGFVVRSGASEVVAQKASALGIRRVRMGEVRMEQTQGAGRILVRDGEAGGFEQSVGLPAPRFVEHRMRRRVVRRPIHGEGVFEMTDGLAPVLGGQVGASGFDLVFDTRVSSRDDLSRAPRTQPTVFGQDEAGGENESDKNNP
jgi:hypothetical protein